MATHGNRQVGGDDCNARAFSFAPPVSGLLTIAIPRRGTQYTVVGSSTGKGALTGISVPQGWALWVSQQYENPTQRIVFERTGFPDTIIYLPSTNGGAMPCRFVAPDPIDAVYIFTPAAGNTFYLWLEDPDAYKRKDSL